MPIKKYCKQCGRELESWSIGWHCANCGCFEDMSGNVHEKRNEPFIPPKTNADKIRNMTDEELYDFISNIDIYRCTCPAKSICDEESCEVNFIKWLKQPAEGE